MINYLAGLGWNDGTDQEIYTVEEVKEAFRLDRVVKAPAMFDMAKLKWVNGQHIRTLDSKELHALVEPVLVATEGLLLGSQPPSDRFVAAVVSNTQGKIDLLTDSADMLKEILTYPFLKTVESGDATALIDDDFKGLAAAVLASYENGDMPESSSSDLEANFKCFVKAIGKTTDRKGKRLFHPVRLALTGSMSGPDVGAQVSLLAEAEGVVNPELLVPLSSRMEILRNWLESS